jgi:hypothetical protein
MGTPQVYPLVWAKQGQTPDQTNKPVVWDPKAPAPGPITPYEKDQILIKQEANPGKTPLETELSNINLHNNVAANTLAQKNRKQKTSSMELPFDPTIEEGTNWNLTGFAPNFDGKWTINEVVFTFSGKSGSRMQIELTQCLDPPNKTPGGAAGGGAAGSGASSKKPITVPQEPTKTSDLLHDAAVNTIDPKPANEANLTLSGNEKQPGWLNDYGSLVPSQQDLHLEDVGGA